MQASHGPWWSGKIPALTSVELQELTELIERAIPHAVGLADVKLLRGRLARARVLLRSEMIANRGRPAYQRIKALVWQARLDNVDKILKGRMAL